MGAGPIVMGSIRPWAQMNADWIDIATGEASRERAAAGDRAAIRQFLGRLADQELEVALEAAMDGNSWSRSLTGGTACFWPSLRASGVRASQKHTKADWPDGRHPGSCFDSRTFICAVSSARDRRREDNAMGHHYEPQNAGHRTRDPLAYHFSIADALGLGLAYIGLKELGGSRSGRPTPQRYSAESVYGLPDVGGSGGSVAAAPEPWAIYHLGDSIELPGISRGQTVLEAHMWPHGVCNPQERVHRLLIEQEGMVRFLSSDVNVAGFEDVAETREGFLSVQTVTGIAEDWTVYPEGWFPEATGSTYVWREYFRIPPRVWRRDTFEDCRTFLVVTGATWHYSQVDDYETRIALSVYSLPFTKNGLSTYRMDQIRDYRDHAEGLPSALRAYLDAHRPLPSSIEARRRLGEQATHPPSHFSAAPPHLAPFTTWKILDA